MTELRIRKLSTSEGSSSDFPSFTSQQHMKKQLCMKKGENLEITWLGCTHFGFGFFFCLDFSFNKEDNIHEYFDVLEAQ